MSMPPKRKHHSWATDTMLIAEVEKRPCLYDRSEEHFTNYELRKDIWKEIGDVVGLSDAVAKQRYRHLRDSFLKRLRKARGNTNATRPTRTHRFATNLKFLLPHISIGESTLMTDVGDRHRQNRRRSGENETDELLSAVSVMMEEEDQQFPKSEHQEERDEVPSATAIHPHATVKRRSHDQNGESMMGYLVAHGSTPREDELDTFFKTICATVRKLPPVLQSQLRFQIMEMVYKAELGHLASE